MWWLCRNYWEMYKVSVPFCLLNLLLFWCSRWRRPPVAKATRKAKILKNSDGFRLVKKATTLHAAAQFWLISLLSLHNYNRNFQCIHMKVNFSFCFFLNSTSREFAYICQSERVGIIARNSAEVSKGEKSLFEGHFCRCRLRGIFILIMIQNV